MTSIQISTNLPEKIINDLNLHDHKMIPGDIILFEVINGDKDFINYLKNLKDDVLISPHFGHPMKQYLSPQEQLDVFNILNSITKGQFEKLDIMPLGNAFKTYKVYDIIDALQKSNQYANQCIHLRDVQNGQILCDLNIMFGNCAVVYRIHKNVYY
jgi:hypothetical protein